MTVLSCLRAPALAGVRAAFRSSNKPANMSLIKATVPSRFMSGPRKMQTKHSMWMWNKLKDHYQFYILIGVLIWGTPMLYCYVRIGPAQLMDIPEGYVPYAYEYIQNPIARWFQTVEPTYEKQYEKTLSIIDMKRHEQQARLLRKRVKKLMREKQDYEGWYYKPHNVSFVYSNEYEEELRNRTRSIKS